MVWRCSRSSRGSSWSPDGSLLRSLFAASALCLLANAMVTAILPLFIRDELGGDAAVVGLVIGGAAPDRYGAARTAAVSQVVAAGGLVVLALASSMTAAAAGAILLGIGFATLQPSLTLLALDRLDPRRRQAGTALFVACMDLGVAAGTALGGLVAEWREEAALMLVAGFTLAGGAVIARG